MKHSFSPGCIVHTVVGKRHVYSETIKPVALSIAELCLAERHSISISEHK